MSDRHEEIKRAAHQALGAFVALLGFKEHRLLDRLLLPDEEIEAMVLGRLRRGGWRECCRRSGRSPRWS